MDRRKLAVSVGWERTPLGRTLIIDVDLGHRRPMDLAGQHRPSHTLDPPWALVECDVPPPAASSESRALEHPYDKAPPRGTTQWPPALVTHDVDRDLGTKRVEVGHGPSVHDIEVEHPASAFTQLVAATPQLMILSWFEF